MAEPRHHGTILIHEPLPKGTWLDDWSRIEPEADARYVQLCMDHGGFPLGTPTGFVWPAPQNLSNMGAITRRVAYRHGLTVEDLRGPSRLREHVYPRQEAMAEIYETGRYSTTRIGQWFGGRDHTTVMHAIRQVEKRAYKVPRDEPAAVRADTAR